jgi:hypothetical protein
MAAFDGQQGLFNITVLSKGKAVPRLIIFRRTGQFIPSVVLKTRYVR